MNLTGATNATLTNVQAAQANIAYAVAVTDNGGLGTITSSNVNALVVTSPSIVSETLPLSETPLNGSSLILTVGAVAVGMTNGFPLSYQWQYDGTNILGANAAAYTNSINPGSSGTYSVIISNAVGTNAASWQVNVLEPGNCWGWGDNEYGESSAPMGVTNFIAVAAGEYNTVAVEENGTVIQWGYDWADVPSDLTNAVAVAAGYDHNIALRSDGTVETWQPAYADDNAAPAGLTGVKAVAAGWLHTVALLTNGTVTAWGYGGEAEGWGLTNVPAGLTNVTAISAQGYFTLALKSDGTVAAWGDDDEGETNVPAGLTNVVDVAAGGSHSLALKADGTITAWGDNTYGQSSAPAGLSNVMAVAAGEYHSVALKNDGTIVCWGDNSAGQASTPAISQVKLIAAGGDQTVAGVFSPTVMYPVDVTKDLLLIYNTNSTDSSIVLNYYLNHRPMVGNANVLGIGCHGFASSLAGTNFIDYETIIPSDFTNEFLYPLTNWLATNPTKRPQYIVMMLNTPSRVNYTLTNSDGSAYYPVSSTNSGVSWHLSTAFQNWSPFVTYINMNGTNDCIAYINKIISFSTNCSQEKLLVSARTGGYWNTNYYLDDTANLYYSNYRLEFPAAQNLTQMGLSTNAVIYNDVYPSCNSLECHLTSATNVAGYISWGCHGFYENTNAAYAVNGTIQFYGNSDWYIIETIESFNGQRYNFSQGNFIDWFSVNAFGGTNYSNTPIGAIANTDEPYLLFIDKPEIYFPYWEQGKCFAICAWASIQNYHFYAVGDPFVTK